MYKKDIWQRFSATFWCFLHRFGCILSENIAWICIKIDKFLHLLFCLFASVTVFQWLYFGCCVSVTLQIMGDRFSGRYINCNFLMIVHKVLSKHVLEIHVILFKTNPWKERSWIFFLHQYYQQNRMSFCKTHGVWCNSLVSERKPESTSTWAFVVVRGSGSKGCHSLSVITRLP